VSPARVGLSSAFRRWANRPLDRGKALSALLVNQLATPGLGSLVAGRRFSGWAQLLLASAGALLFFVWWFRVLSFYYELMLWDEPAQEPNLHHGLGKLGAALFGVAWLWALGTGISLYREARTKARRALLDGEAQPPVIAEYDARQ
jgi:hypothetical protein